MSDAAAERDAISREVAALVERARAGDRRAFDDLVRRTYDNTYALALRLTGDAHDAHDVVQEAYLRALRGLRRFRGEARFTTWLYRITANCASTHRDRRQRHRYEELGDRTVVADTGKDGNPEARADTGWLRERLNAALDRLPPRLRTVVVLRDIYGLAHKTIAAELGISESAAKVRLHRAHKRLQVELGESDWSEWPKAS
jgi:RNA polymerase sigma-70 factor, ECF subfamily